MNHCNLFEEENDYIKIMDILSALKEEIAFEIIAYCFMSNHVHLLVKEKDMGDIITIMRRLLTKYAGWFNRKYQRSGSLIANRYKSECVETDEYLFVLVRYIHQNPLKAKMATSFANHKWSSYFEYAANRAFPCIADKQLLLNQFSEKGAKQAIQAFVHFHHEAESAAEHEPTDRRRRTSEEVRQILINELGGTEPNNIAGLSKSERNDKLRRFRELGLSIRQIERATGISRGVIAKS
jgi:REP element-mobilizing transposase RayT